MLTTNFYEFDLKTNITYLDNGLFNMREEGGRQAGKQERKGKSNQSNDLFVLS